MTPIHPAQFSDNLIAPMADMLGWFERGGILLDPCAGLGWKLARLAEMVRLDPVGFDIEAKLYADHAHPCVSYADSTMIPWLSEAATAAVTSFVYPNGMADSFHSSDGTVRHTYVHHARAVLADPSIELQPNNMAGMNPRRSPRVLQRFMDTQEMIVREVFRVLGPGAPFVVNTKDPPYNDHYTADTMTQLENAGFVIEALEEVPAKGQNHGANQGHKSTHEMLTLARRPS